MRVLQAKPNRKDQIIRLMRRIRVDPYGVRIMLPKAVSCMVDAGPVSNIKANILKQEMLSLGGDAAIAREALTGGTKSTGCLLMGNLAQFRRLNEKLKAQPFGLDKLASEISLALANYQKDSFKLELGRYKLTLAAEKAAIMGIINLTPDSFSGDGLYRLSHTANRISQIDNIVRYAEQMVRDGADIIDMGGESSRPGAKPVSVKEELKRVIPVLKKITKKIKVPASVDTYKPEVAKAALDNGAVIVNDINGLRDRKLAKVAARYKAGVVIMHMQGVPRSMQRNPRYTCVVEEIIDFLSAGIERALAAGIDREKIIVDPGIGFGKSVGHNLEILRRLDEFRALGRPILVGVSRKSFIGKVLDAGVAERLYGTISAAVAAVSRGAKLVRTHEVSALRQALDVLSAIDQTHF